MICLVSGALATIIGQVVSFLLSVFYIPRMKTFKLKKSDFKLNKSAFKIMSLGLSSFITHVDRDASISSAVESK